MWLSVVVKCNITEKHTIKKKCCIFNIFIIFLCNYSLCSKQNLTNYNYYNEKASLYFGNDVAVTIYCV